MCILFMHGCARIASEALTYLSALNDDVDFFNDTGPVWRKGEELHMLQTPGGIR